MGAGAMIGELPNSFVKRRLGVPPGAAARGWKAAVLYVSDQVDLLTGAWPAVTPWLCRRDRCHGNDLGLVLVASFGVALALHPIVALIGYVVGARRGAR